MSLMTHCRPFMLMHALFALADSKCEQVHTNFVTHFVDMLVLSIRNGTIPDIDRIDHVRGHLQVSCSFQH